MVVQKVQARTIQKVVAEGLITEDERRIDEKVDLKAKKVARSYLVDNEVKRKLFKTIDIKVAMQRVMVAILGARRDKPPQLQKKFPIGREGSVEQYDQQPEATYEGHRGDD